MKKLFEHASQIAKEAQIIADNLAKYNPGLCKNKVPLDVIQYDVASLARELARLHGEIGDMENKFELIRVITRSVAFVAPLIAICIGMFTLDEVQDTLIGAVMGMASMAGVFYFKKPDD